MTVDDLEVLFGYGYWANRRLFQALSPLAPDEFTRPVGPGHASIRNTLVHVLSAEWGWLDRCGGPARGARLDPGDYPTLESVVERWAAVERHVREFLGGLEDADLAREIAYVGGGGETFSMPLGELLQHAANHAVHHRGQVAPLLRQLGHAPPDLDLLFFLAERRGVRAW